MSENPGSESWKSVHPDFDGHLQKPIERMTMEERAIWAWQGMELLHWARREAQRRPQDERADAERPKKPK